MRLATTLRYGLARWLLKAGGLPIVPPWVTESFITPSFRSLVTEGYAKNAAVFACIETLALAFMEPPLRLYDSDAEDARVLPSHPARKLLQRPNPRMGETGLKLATITYAAIGGNAYLHKVRGRAGQVVELWPYHAGQIRAVPGGDTWVTGYVFDDGTGTLRPIPAEDIIHVQWPSPDPTQPWQAQPPLAAAGREVDTDNEITRYLFALLKNDAVPRVALKLPPGNSVKDAEIRRMRQQWRERYGGDNRGDVAILEQGSELQRIGLDLAELAFDALHRIPETRIAAALRVPPILAGLAAGLERSTYSNYGEARRSFAEDTLVPLWSLLDTTLTAQLIVPDFGGAAVVRSDLSRVKALQEDLGARWKRAGDGYARGLITKNEGRRYLGFGDVPDGEAFVAAPQRALLAAEPAKARPAAPKALPAPAGAVKASTDPIETRIRRAAQSYLAHEYATAAAGVRDMDKRAPDAPLDPDIVAQLGLDLGPAIRAALARFYPLLLARAFDDAAIQLDVDVAFDLENPQVQATLAELAQLVTRVADTTRDEIRTLVGQQAAEGWSIAQLADAIARRGEVQSVTRATVIARTETASAYSRGSILAWQESGVVGQVEWDATLDDVTATACQALHGQRAPLGGTFADGVAFPPQHPNCRCALLPIVE